MDFDLKEIPKDFDLLEFKKKCFKNGLHIVKLETNSNSITQDFNGSGRIQLRGLTENQFNDFYKIVKEKGIQVAEHSNQKSSKSK